MPANQVVSREEWLAARRAHLAREKELTRLRDELSRERQALPWVRVDADYQFGGPAGPESLADLFGPHSQLIIYHFMYGADWEEGCPSCSFWADNFNGIDVHLAHRDISLVVVSRAPQAQLDAYKKRMGWSFKWVSSYGTSFNEDYHVSPTADEIAQGRRFYNYGEGELRGDESPGISVFYKDESGAIFHTYSCYSRGLDMLNGAYHFMDLAPQGRAEATLPWTMAWLRRHDQYED
ncbi:MAG: DUF899 domain-containing protein [Anaerolineales bacterium]|nr:DUF899 domain-containing protein [Anaerolineales bacterium]